MVKIYAFLILSFLVGTSTYCQFEKGQKIIGGNIGFVTGKTNNSYSGSYTSAYSNVSINPSFGWFIKPNVLWGIGLLYGLNYQKNNIYMAPDVTKIWRNSLGVNVFSQKFFNLTRNFFFTVNTSGGAGYSFGKQTNTANDIENKSTNSGYSVSLSVSPGLSYRLTPRLLFDANLSNLIYISYYYNQTKAKDAVGSDIKTFDKSFSLSSSLSNTTLGNVGLGFRWLLKKK